LRDFLKIVSLTEKFVGHSDRT